MTKRYESDQPVAGILPVAWFVGHGTNLTMVVAWILGEGKMGELCDLPYGRLKMEIFGSVPNGSGFVIAKYSDNTFELVGRVTVPTKIVKESCGASQPSTNMTPPAEDLDFMRHMQAAQQAGKLSVLRAAHF